MDLGTKPSHLFQPGHYVPKLSLLPSIVCHLIRIPTVAENRGKAKAKV